MDMTKKHSRKRRVAGVVLLSLFLAGYLAFVVIRYSEYSMYIPFIGRVFRLNGEEVEKIRMVSGSTGNIADVEDEETVRELVDYLNSFRCQYWVPKIPLEAGGYSFALWIELNGESNYFQLTPDSILVKGIWFHGKPGSLQRLTDLVDGPQWE